eukprot:Hpha_TRINITY_DN16152_c3_g1::TRINITY_DN16152_c3_g1_i2::g.6108::m.6108
MHGDPKNKKRHKQQKTTKTKHIPEKNTRQQTHIDLRSFVMDTFYWTTKWTAEAAHHPRSPRSLRQSISFKQTQVIGKREREREREREKEAERSRGRRKRANQEEQNKGEEHPSPTFSPTEAPSSPPSPFPISDPTQ